MKKISYESIIEKAQLKNQVESLSSILNKKESDIDTLNTTLVQKDNKISVLNSKLAEKASSFNNLQSQLSIQANSYKSQINNLESQLSTKDREFSNAHSQIQNYKETIKNLKDELGVKDNRIELLQSELSDKELSNNTLSEKITDIEKDLLQKVLTIHELEQDQIKNQKSLKGSDIFLAEKLKEITKLKKDLELKQTINKNSEKIINDLNLKLKLVKNDKQLIELQFTKYKMESIDGFDQSQISNVEEFIQSIEKKQDSLNQQINEPTKVESTNQFFQENQNKYPSLELEEETELVGDHAGYKFGFDQQH